MGKAQRGLHQRRSVRSKEIPHLPRFQGDLGLASQEVRTRRLNSTTGFSFLTPQSEQLPHRLIPEEDRSLRGPRHQHHLNSTCHERLLREHGLCWSPHSKGRVGSWDVEARCPLVSTLVPTRPQHRDTLRPLQKFSNGSLNYVEQTHERGELSEQFPQSVLASGAQNSPRPPPNWRAGAAGSGLGGTAGLTWKQWTRMPLSLPKSTVPKNPLCFIL